MNPEHFRNSLSGRTVKIGRDEFAYWAFAPNPLPPKLPLDLALLRSLSEADRALGELAGLGRTISNPHLLIRPFIHREAVLSSRIEGTQADVADLYAYEAGQLALPGMEPHPPESDVLEVLNYVHALEYGLERLQTLPVSLRLFRELHQRLMSGVRGEKLTPGEFRRTQNWIGRPGCTLKNADYVPPPPDDLLDALSLLESYLHAEPIYPPLIRLAFIHYQFEAIHPFLDGNGRIGRLLMTLLMNHWELPPLPLLYLSAYFHRQRDRYYDLLMAVSQRGAWREWVRFFLQGVTEQSHDAGAKARNLQDLQMEWRERLSQARTSALLLRLADELFVSPIITIPQAQRILDVTYPSAQRNVERLVKAGILEQLGSTSYNRTFIAKEILDLLDEDLDE